MPIFLFFSHLFLFIFLIFLISFLTSISNHRHRLSYFIMLSNFDFDSQLNCLNHLHLLVPLQLLIFWSKNPLILHQHSYLLLWSHLFSFFHRNSIIIVRLSLMQAIFDIFSSCASPIHFRIFSQGSWNTFR